MEGSRYLVLLADGPKRKVSCARRTNGSSESRDYLESIDDKAQVKFAALFQRMADAGVLSENKIKLLEDSGGIWEFKSGEHRSLCFRDGPVWVVTHGFRKRGQKTPMNQITRAQTIRSEYFELKDQCREDE